MEGNSRPKFLSRSFALNDYQTAHSGTFLKVQARRRRDTFSSLFLSSFLFLRVTFNRISHAHLLQSSRRTCCRSFVRVSRDTFIRRLSNVLLKYNNLRFATLKYRVPLLPFLRLRLISAFFFLVRFFTPASAKNKNRVGSISRHTPSLSPLFTAAMCVCVYVCMLLKFIRLSALRLKIRVCTRRRRRTEASDGNSINRVFIEWHIHIHTHAHTYVYVCMRIGENCR